MNSRKKTPRISSWSDCPSSVSFQQKKTISNGFYYFAACEKNKFDINKAIITVWCQLRESDNKKQHNSPQRSCVDFALSLPLLASISAAPQGRTSCKGAIIFNALCSSVVLYTRNRLPRVGQINKTFDFTTLRVNSPSPVSLLAVMMRNSNPACRCMVCTVLAQSSPLT